MAWARIDDGFDDHPKILALLEEEQGAAAVGLWTLCLTWAHRNTRKKGKTPGLIPSGLPRRYLGPGGRDLAKLLVAHELWDESDDGGWMIHDFAEYLPTEETKAARSAAGKRGAEKRWAAKRQAEAEAEMAKEKQADGTLPSGSHDGASNDVASDGSRAPARRAISKEIAPEPGPEELPLPPEAGADKPRRGEAGASSRKRPRAASNNAGDVIAAYVDGARDAGLPVPGEKLRARVGREARGLLAKDPDQLSALVAAARNMGAAGWHDLSVQVQRDAVNARNGQGSDGTRSSSFAPNTGARARTYTAEEIENMNLEGKV